MKPILYIANMRLPSERAHSVHVMEMCAALSAVNGGNVTLLVPNRHTDVEEKDIFKYYGVPKTFEIVRCKSLDAFRYKWISRRFAYYIHSISFMLSVFWKIKRFPEVLVLSRDLLTAWLLSGKRTVAFEVHDLPGRNLIGRWMLQRLSYIITTNQLKKNWLVNELGIEAKKIYLAPNAVNERRFTKLIKAAGERLRIKGWPQGNIILYVGSLLPWKGVSTLVSSVKFLPPDIFVVIVGGDKNEGDRLLEQVEQKEIKARIYIFPHEPHSTAPILLASANVLVLPTSGKTQIGRDETSPIKVFEYLAAQKPVVASDVPSSREVLDESMAIFFRPDDGRDCARAIMDAMNLSAEVKQKMISAQNDFIKNHTWENRARSILNFISL